jgi:hypothetical protein
VSATDGITYLERAGKACAAEDQDAEGLRTFACVKGEMPGIMPRPIPPPAMAESLRKVLRLVDINFAPEKTE